MKFLRAMLPNLSFALNISMLVVVYLDQRNPMMGFLMGTPFFVLAYLSGLSAIATAIVVYADWRKTGKSQKQEPAPEEKTGKISE